MNKIGKVTGILNDELLLFSSTETFVPGENLFVFEERIIEGLKDKVDLERVHFPKGKISVLAKQDGNIFLATTVTKHVVRENRLTTNPFNALSGLAGLFETKEVVEVERSQPTAKLDKTNSFELKFDHIVRLGDFVSKEEKRI